MTTRSGSSRPDLDTGQWKRIRAAVRRRDGNVCVVCGGAIGSACTTLCRRGWAEATRWTTS